MCSYAFSLFRLVVKVAIMFETHTHQTPCPLLRVYRGLMSFYYILNLGLVPPADSSFVEPGTFKGSNLCYKALPEKVVCFLFRRFFPHVFKQHFTAPCIRGQATVTGNNLSCDKRTFFGSEKEGDVCHFFRFAQSSHRCDPFLGIAECFAASVFLRTGHLINQWRFDCSGCNSIGADSLPCVIDRGCFRHVIHSALGSGVTNTF